MKKTKKRGSLGTLLLCSLVVFAAMVVHVLVSGAVTFLLVWLGLITVSPGAVPDTGWLLLFLGFISLPVGALLAVLVGKYPLQPFRDLITGMNRLAAGDFSTRVKTDSLMFRYPAFREAAESFNLMARELENTEVLRADFVNNFSHEFKTPIVSIAGFAKLLRRGKLPPEQQREYLEVIETEALRLSDMATRVLELTKIENQEILTDVTEFNLSEQIRSCVLLLESKWSRKDLELVLEFGEHSIRANEDLLKQVWINLLDNAVKFAPEGHTVQVTVTAEEGALAVTVMNTGSHIPPEHREQIFRKFCQADRSHSGQGNGVGLAVVKKITQLHGGTVTVESENDVTSFTVSLPQ